MGWFLRGVRGAETRYRRRMQWIDEPPCTHLQVHYTFPHHLELDGPRALDRLSGGGHALGGAWLLSWGLRFARLAPGPVKLIPLGLSALGAGLTALGVAEAILQVRVSITREAILCAWEVGPRKRELTLSKADLAWLEVDEPLVRLGSVRFGARSAFDDEPVPPAWRLVAVMRDGRRVALELFHAREEADARKAQATAVLGIPG